MARAHSSPAPPGALAFSNMKGLYAALKQICWRRRKESGEKVPGMTGKYILRSKRARDALAAWLRERVNVSHPDDSSESVRISLSHAQPCTCLRACPRAAKSCVRHHGALSACAGNAWACCVKSSCAHERARAHSATKTPADARRTALRP